MKKSDAVFELLIMNQNEKDMIRKHIKMAQMTLSLRKFDKYVGNNFSYDKNEVIEVLREMIAAKEETEEYEECAEILQAINHVSEGLIA